MKMSRKIKVITIDELRELAKEIGAEFEAYYSPNGKLNGHTRFRIGERIVDVWTTGTVLIPWTKNYLDLKDVKQYLSTGKAKKYQKDNVPIPMVHFYKNAIPLEG